MEIKVRDLRKQYGEVTVLKDLQLDLEGIHTLVIIGPSGGGKSTFLRIIAGLETIQEGDILINGEGIPKDEKELLEYRKKVGVVFQAFNLFPHLSALRNITLPLEKVHGISPEEAHERGVKLLRRYKLEEHMHKKPHQLSGGQQQRVAIIRALALEVNFFLLDEPTSALDPSLTMETLHAIRELKNLKKNLILVTHEMGFAKNVADYILFIAEGKVLESGTPKDIFQHPKTPQLKEFLGQALHY